MFDIRNYLNIKKTTHVNKEYFISMATDNSISRGGIILLLFINLIISSLFILFSLDYINVINPKLNIPNKTIYLILVYFLLVSNSFQFIISLINMIQCILIV